MCKFHQNYTHLEIFQKGILVNVKNATLQNYFVFSHFILFLLFLCVKPFVIVKIKLK